MNNNIQHDEYKNSTKLRDKTNEWEKIIDYGGDNKTILKKEIYKDPYDYSDNSSKGKLFVSKRKEFLKQLPTIEQDNNFGYPYKNTTIQERNVTITETSRNNSYNNNNNNYNKMKKDDWFKDKRDGIAQPSKEMTGLNCLQKSLSASNSRKNNLYHMKSLVNA